MRFILLVSLLIVNVYSLDRKECSNRATFGDTNDDKAARCADFSTSDPCGCTYGGSGEACEAAPCPTTTAVITLKPCSELATFGNTDADKADRCSTFATSDPCGCTFPNGGSGEGCVADTCPTTTAVVTTTTQAETTTTTTTTEATTEATTETATTTTTTEAATTEVVTDECPRERIGDKCETDSNCPECMKCCAARHECEMRDPYARFFKAKSSVNQLLNEPVPVPNNAYTNLFGYILLVGIVAFILINNLFIGYWCLNKTNNNSNVTLEYAKCDMITVNDE